MSARTCRMHHYEQWLNSWSPRSADAPGVFARQVAALPTATALVAIERFEQACLSETSSIRVARTQASPPSNAQELQARMVAEEKHLALAAKIQWARYARSQIKTFSIARADGRMGTPSMAPAGEPADGRVGAWTLGRVGGAGSAP
jgi:hypothetical protein